MGFARTHGVVLLGVEGRVVTVEAQAGDGLPRTVVTGRADEACRQAPDRVRPAISSLGLAMPPRRWTVNLSPAGLPKTGGGLDLAIAAVMLAAQGHLAAEVTAGVAHIGEVGLSGEVRPVHGVLPMVLAAARSGVPEVVVARANAREASLVEQVQVHPVASVRDLIRVHQARAGGDPVPVSWPEPAAPVPDQVPDLSDVVGQVEARHALEVCAAGGHNLLLVGPPGAGKTMLAERLAGLLPPLGEQDALAVTAIHSVLGVLPQDDALVRRPPFVAPHHTASTTAVIGGGSGRIVPGAVSRAHRGLLFLDEAPEFRRDVLDGLRQPLESGEVVIARAERHLRLPARFQLVLAANPCPCGSGLGPAHRVSCTCTPHQRNGYLARLSGPLVDRVDLRIGVAPVTRADLTLPPGEGSAPVVARVLRARDRQRRRWADAPWSLNSEVPGAQLRRGRWRLPSRDVAPLARAMDTGRLTLRGLDRCLRVAWTLADLQDLPSPGPAQVRTALAMRDAQGVRAA